MSKTIHIHIHGRTRDADGPAHAPAGSSKGGQFISGGGGGGSSAAPATGGSASKEHTDLVKYHAHVSKNSATSRVSWASVAKEANKALASGKLSPAEHKAATAIHKEASGKANTLPKPGVPNVGAYAHLTKK